MFFYNDPPERPPEDVEPTGYVPTRNFTDLQQVEVTYDSASKYECTETYLYTDDFFNWPSSMYDPDLAIASVYLSVASFGAPSRMPESQYRYAFEFLDNIGFENLDVNDDFKQFPGTYTMGAVAGMKELTDESGDTFTVIALSTRGDGYGNEWASNFLVGNGEDSYGHHKGFYDSALKVIDFLKGYITKYEISGNIKVWTSGFSRGAAVANVTAGLLDTALADGGLPLGESVVFDKYDLYCYTIATPAGVYYDGTDAYPNPHSKTYNNIKNMIVYGDMIPKLTFRDMGFHRYGTDINISDIKDFDYEGRKRIAIEMYNAYEGLENYKTYFVDRFIPYKIDLSNFNNLDDIVQVDLTSKKTFDSTLDSFFGKLSAGIEDRQWFVDNIQDPFIELYDVLTEVDQRYSPYEFIFALVQLKMQQGDTVLQNLGLKILGNGDISDDIEGDVSYLLSRMGRDPSKAADISDGINTFIHSIKSLVLNGDIVILNDLVSIAMNYESIGLPHYCELYMSWMKSDNQHYRTLFYGL